MTEGIIGSVPREPLPLSIKEELEKVKEIERMLVGGFGVLECDQPHEEDKWEIKHEKTGKPVWQVTEKKKEEGRKGRITTTAWECQLVGKDEQTEGLPSITFYSHTKDSSISEPQEAENGKFAQVEIHRPAVEKEEGEKPAIVWDEEAGILVEGSSKDSFRKKERALKKAVENFSQGGEWGTKGTSTREFLQGLGAGLAVFASRGIIDKISQIPPAAPVPSKESLPSAEEEAPWWGKLKRVTPLYGFDPSGDKLVHQNWLQPNEGDDTIGVYGLNEFLVQTSLWGQYVPRSFVDGLESQNLGTERSAPWTGRVTAPGPIYSLQEKAGGGDYGLVEIGKLEMRGKPGVYAVSDDKRWLGTSRWLQFTEAKFVEGWWNQEITFDEPWDERLLALPEAERAQVKWVKETFRGNLLEAMTIDQENPLVQEFIAEGIQVARASLEQGADRDSVTRALSDYLHTKILSRYTSALEGSTLSKVLNEGGDCFQLGTALNVLMYHAQEKLQKEGFKFAVHARAILGEILTETETSKMVEVFQALNVTEPGFELYLQKFLKGSLGHLFVIYEGFNGEIMVADPALSQYMSFQEYKRKLDGVKIDRFYRYQP